ncbi:MAG: PilW family protein [Methylococcaceae bacterium]
MNKTSLIQQFRIKKKEQVVAYLKKAFKGFDQPVYLFGSYATGQFHGASDVDILIISPDALSAEVHRQACEQMTGLGMNYDILVSSSLERLDGSIVNSLQIISATAPCVALPPASMQSSATAPCVALPPASMQSSATAPCVALDRRSGRDSTFSTFGVELCRRQRGMTLIEIMIALLIGAFLMGGVLQIFISSKQTNRMQEGLSRLQENGRFAVNFISKDIRRAGFQGCPSLRNGNVIPNVIASAPVIPALTENTLISGANNIDPSWDANACGAGGVCIAGTDAISVTYGESCSGNLSAAMADVNATVQILAVNTCGISATDAVLISNCSSADIFRATSSGTTIQHSALNTAYGMDAELFNYHAYSYFIRESTSGAPERSLWRLDNTRATSGSNPTELIEGIEDMQILYGVDIDDDDDGNTATSAPDGPANYYVSADNIPDIDVNGAPDWFRVISIRISVLAVTLDDNLSAQPVPYSYNGATITPTDSKIRRVFNTTIVLRNRLP